MGYIAQELALAADQRLQPRTHAVEVARQHAELIATRRQAGQRLLLVRRLAQVMYGAAQAIQRPGNGKRK